MTMIYILYKACTKLASLLSFTRRMQRALPQSMTAEPRPCTPAVLHFLHEVQLHQPWSHNSCSCPAFLACSSTASALVSRQLQLLRSLVRPMR